MPTMKTILRIAGIAALTMAVINRIPQARAIVYKTQ